MNGSSRRRSGTRPRDRRRRRRRGHRRSRGSSIRRDLSEQNDAGGSRARRLARNEDFFREANELLREEADRQGRTASQIICECSTVGCLERIAVTRAEYEQARAEGAWFLVVPGHEDLSIEVVVQRNERFCVVEKRGPAGAQARADDPRYSEPRAPRASRRAAAPFKEAATTGESQAGN
jgi:hypothetical protein